MNQKPSQKLLFWTTAAAAFLEPEQTVLNRLSWGLSISSGIWGGDFIPELHWFCPKFYFFLLPRLRSTQRFLSSQLFCRCQDMTGRFKGLLFLKNDMPAMFCCCSRGVVEISILRKKDWKGYDSVISCLGPQWLCGPWAVTSSEALKSHLQSVVPFVKSETQIWAG